MKHMYTWGAIVGVTGWGLKALPVKPGRALTGPGGIDTAPAADAISPVTRAVATATVVMRALPTNPSDLRLCEGQAA